MAEGPPDYNLVAKPLHDRNQLINMDFFTGFTQ